MTPEEILHVIVATEQSARSLYSEALQKQEGFSKYIEDKKQQLRDEFFAAADAEISEFEAREAQKAQEAIERLNEKLFLDLSRSKRRYENHRTEYAKKLFDTVVNADG